MGLKFRWIKNLYRYYLVIDIFDLNFTEINLIYSIMLWIIMPA